MDRVRAVRTIGTFVSVAIAGAVVAAAVVSSFTGGDSATTATTAADTATTATAIQVGGLARLPRPDVALTVGSLIAGEEDCTPFVIPGGGSRGVGGSLPFDACHLWSSSNGRYLLWTPGPAPPDGQPLGLHDLLAVPGASTGITLGPPASGTPVVTDRGTVAACSVAGIEVSRGRRAARLVRPVARQPAAAITEECSVAALGDRIVGVDASHGRLVDLESGALVLRLAPPPLDRVAAIVATPDGASIAVCFFGEASLATTLYRRDGSARYVNVPTAIGVRIRKALLASGGNTIALRTEAGWEIADLTDGSRLTAISGNPITDVTFSPDGATIAAVVPDGIVYLDAARLAPIAFTPQPDLQSIVWVP